MNKTLFIISIIISITLVACGGSVKEEIKTVEVAKEKTLSDLANDYKALLDKSTQLQQSALDGEEDDDSAVPQEIAEINEQMNELLDENKSVIDKLTSEQKAQFFSGTWSTKETKK